MCCVQFRLKTGTGWNGMEFKLSSTISVTNFVVLDQSGCKYIKREYKCIIYMYVHPLSTRVIGIIRPPTRSV